MLWMTSCPSDFVFDALDEIAGDLEIDVGLQQRHAHFAQGVADVVLGNFAEAAQILESVLELAAERIEHEARLRQRFGADKEGGTRPRVS